MLRPPAPPWRPLPRAALGALAPGLALVVALTADPAAAQDVTGPSLVDCVVAPSPLDATAGPATGTWSVELSDDLSGIASAGVLFVDPGFSTLVSANVDPSHRTSGDALNGIYEVAFDVPEYSPSGTWGVFALSVRDVAGNTTQVPVAGLPATCGFELVSVPDLGAPTVAALSVTPGAADVTLDPGAFVLTAVLEDDVSGVSHADVTLESPSGGETVVASLTSEELVAGDALSGTYDVGFEVPQLAESGTWSVASVRIVDAYGRIANVDGASLVTPPPPTFDISSTPDGAPPEVVWFEATPQIVYRGASTPSVRLRARIRDDVTGLGVNGILLEGPEEGHLEGVSFTQDDRIQGTALDGVYEATIEFDPGAALGGWAITISVADAAGNDVQLTGGGIPGQSQVFVVAGSPPPPAVPAAGPLGLGAMVTGLLGAGLRRLAGSRRSPRPHA